MSENSSHDHVEGQGHRGHMTSRWTCLAIVDEGKV